MERQFETEKKLREIIAIENCQLVRFEKAGLSGAMVAVVRDNATRELCALKYGRPKTINDEVAGYNLLKPYFDGRLVPIQSFRQVSPDEMLMKSPYIEGETFHQSLVRNHLSETQALNINQEILQKYLLLWSSTIRRNEGEKCLRDYNLRAKEAVDYLKTLSFNGISLVDIWNLPMKINGVEYPSISIIDEEISAINLQPNSFVLAWGDGHPNNILVDSAAKWRCIDFEYVSSNNIWEEPLIRYLFWWRSEATKNVFEPKLSVVGQNIVLEYELSFPNACSQIEKTGLKVAEEMAKIVKNNDWEKRFQTLMAVYFWRRMMYQHLFHRQDYLIPLLGEGIRSLFGNL